MERTREERLELFHSHYNLAVSMASKYALTGGRKGEADDLVQVALMALWDATAKYDPARGSMSNCATLYIRQQLDISKDANGVSQQSRRYGEKARSKGVPERFRRPKFTRGYALDNLPAAGLKQDIPALCDEVRGLLSNLSDLESAVVSGQLDGVSQADIARKIGVSRERVSKLTANAVRRLRELVGG